ncbi:MAG: ABC transporter ATP-binding protein [Oligoflexia bacterium]|nr:ABC transporter ATP-binding protein [Oligoflexia bacterium]
MTNDKSILISAKKITKVFRAQGSLEGLEVLKSVDLDVYRGEALCIMGNSGAGKSTLLHILSTLDSATIGHVLFAGQDLSKLSQAALSQLRNQKMGFVFQFHHLLNEFTALENVMMPLLIAGESFSNAARSAEKILNDLGLKDRKSHRPSALSGGEAQRVAIARAIVREPQVIFADEPTGNLDQKNGQIVQNVLFDLNRKRGVTLVAVTHDFEFGRRFPRVKTLRDGQWF